MMKSLLIAALLTAASSHAETLVRDTTMVKTDDGRVLTCDRPDHAERWGYRPTLYWVNAKGPESIQVSISMAALICKQGPNGLAFEVRRMNDPVTTLLPNGERVPLSFRHQDAVLFSADSQLLGRVPTANETIQTFNYDIPFQRLLNKRERLALESGSKVKLTVGFMIVSTTAIETPSGAVVLSPRPGGAYNLMFSLIMDKGEVKVLDSALR